ncbi:hypothetical protein S245_004803, partial [Arachis hypogaea]
KLELGLLQQSRRRSLTQLHKLEGRFSPNQKRKLKQETLASPPPPQGLSPSVALRHYHRCLVVRASSSFKNHSFFFLELSASFHGIHLFRRAPTAVHRTLRHYRLCLVATGSSNPPPSSESCSLPRLYLRHDSAPLLKLLRRKTLLCSNFFPSSSERRSLTRKKNPRLR